MKKIWQKSLASMVSAALCLTAFVGCLTVSAEKGSATITVGNGSAKPGKTVVVPVEIKANTSTDPAVEKIGGVAVALFDLQFDTTNLTVTDVSVPKDSYYCAEPKYTDAQGTTIAVDPATNTIKILASFMDTTGKDYPLDFDLMTVNVTFKVSADAKAGEYPVTIYKAQACDAGTKTGTLGNYQYADDEDLIALATVNGKVTVTSDCEHANATKTDVINVTETEFIYAIDCPDCQKENLTINIPINNVEVAGNKVTRTIKPGNDIALWFMFKKDQQVGYTDLCLVVEKEVYEFSANEPNANKQVFYLTDPIDGYNSSGILCDTFVFDKLAAYEMTNEVSVKLYGYSAAKEMQLIKTTTYSIRQFLETKIKAGGNEYLMKTFVDILNYGAASQSLADIMINTDDLANSRLTEAQKAYGTQESEYCDTNTEFVDASKPAVYNYDSPVGYVTPVSTIAPESKVNIYFKFRVVSKDGTTTYFTGDVNNLYCRYYYTDVMGTDQVVDRHYDGLTRDGLNAFKFDLQPIAQLDKAVKAVVYYGDPNESSSYQIMEKEYSLEAFVKSQIGKATPEVKQLLQTMYAYGYSLKYCVDNGLV